MAVVFNYIGLGMSKVYVTLGGARPYLDTVLETPFLAIQEKMNAVLDGTLSEGNLEKNKVVDLTDTLQSTAKAGERYALATAFACYMITQFSPYFGTTLTVAALGFSLVAYDMHQLHHATLQLKTWLSNSGSTLSQENFLQQMSLMRGAVQNNAILFPRSVFYGRELEALPDFASRKISTAVDSNGHNTVEWLPEESREPSTLIEYVAALNQKVRALFNSRSNQIDADKLQEVVNLILRPLAFGRAASCVAALLLYLASGYVPLFSSLLLVQAWGAAFFAWEFHQVHDCVREELGDWLIDHWGEKVSSDDVTTRVKNCAVLIQESSFILDSRYIFQSEIESLPKFFADLVAQNGNLSTVQWVRNGTLETLVGLFESALIFSPTE